MLNITRNQFLSLLALGLSLLAAGGATLTQIFGAGLAGQIAAAAGFLSSFVNGAIVILTSQGQQVKDVAAMPGVQGVAVNAQANSTLATLAVDPAQGKIAASPKDIQAVAETAKTAAGT